MNKKELYNSLFYYTDGVLYNRSNNKPAGNKRPDNYIDVKSNNIRDYQHRIIYTMFHGDIPEFHDIHHIDEDRSNNRIENLEPLSRLKHNFKKDKPPIKNKNGNWQIITQHNYNNYKFEDIDKNKVLKSYNSFCKNVINDAPLDVYKNYIIRKKNKDVKVSINQEYLLKNYYYKDGDLFKISTNQKIGHLSKSGYYMAMICGHGKGVHRWIYMYHYGDIPDKMVIDHIDNNRLNNKIENLRCASPGLNSINTKRKYQPLKYHSGGFRVSTQRDGKRYRKYFTSNKYQEALKFCLALDEAREDTDKIKELYNLII
jgi:hypothetical protein